MATTGDRVPRPGTPVLSIAPGGGQATLPGAQTDFDNLEIEIETDPGIYWCFLNPGDRPSFTTPLLRDLSAMQRSLTRIFAAAPRNETPLKYFVVDSRIPGIFNLGGDLTYFAELIRQQDRARLREYGLACIEVIYRNAIAYDLPLITFALVRGDALGGGFEAALSCDIIVAEKGAKFGLPEILFNLFPGMGAYSLLERRLGAAKAEKMILSGHIYSAEELFELDLVHVLAEPGEGEAVVRDYIRRHSRRHNAQSAIYNVGRKVRPLPYSELQEVVDIWVETALKLGRNDLRKMERFVTAQSRRWNPGASAADQLKRA